MNLPHHHPPHHHPPLHPAPPPYVVRDYGLVNWIGLFALARKEIYRFLAVYTQTILAPVVTTLLFLAIFSLALGGAVRTIHDMPFEIFLAPGLIIMSMSQNAFANTSSSMVISKIQGNIVDVLMPPISAGELIIAYTLGGIIRGIVVGIATLIGVTLFVTIEINHVWAVLAFGGLGSMMLALLGLAGGIWSDKFDHIAAVTNFIIMPFSFLSGTFYTIDRLPEPFSSFAWYNPFFYMIDGFRYGFLGRADASPTLALAVLIATNIALTILVWRMVNNGYKLKC